MKSLAIIAVGVAALAAPRTAAAAYTYEVVADIPADSPSDLAVDSSLHQVYAVNGSAVLEVFDGTTDTLIAQVSLGGSLRNVVVDPTTHFVFVSNRGNGVMDVLDGTSLQVVAEVPVEGLALTDLMAIDPSTHTVYVFAAGGLVAIDGVSALVTGVLPLEAGELAVDPVTHKVYSPDPQSHALYVVDGLTDTLVDTVPYGVAQVHEAIAVDPVLHTIYIGNDEPVKTVSVLDATTYALLATVPVGTGMSILANDPATHTVYVLGAEVIVAIDGNTNTVVATIPVDNGPNGIGIDSSTSAAFVGGSGGILKILPFCNAIGCAHPQIVRLGAVVAGDHVDHGLALSLLVADVAQLTGHKLIACRAMGVFVSGTEHGDGTFLSDVLATDWINQAEAIEGGMGCF